MKKRIMIYTILLFTAVAILSLLYINIKTPFAEMIDNNKTHKQFENYKDYKNEIDGFLFPEDILGLKCFENGVTYDDNNNALWSIVGLNKKDKTLSIFTGLFTKGSYVEKVMFRGLISGERVAILDNYKELDFKLDGFDEVFIFLEEDSNQYHLLAANKINDLNYSFITIMSDGMDFEDFEKVIRSVK